MARLALIGLAGAAGALCRLGVANVVGERSWPWATVVVNVSGAFALGLVLAWATGRWSPAVLAAVGIGFLGSFTTFSTLALDAVRLGEGDSGAAAGAYLLLSMGLGVGAAVLGQVLGRSLAQ